MIRDVIVSFAAFGGAFLWERNPKINFFTAAAFGLLGTLYFTFDGKAKIGEYHCRGLAITI
jgi:hypothetical protein